ncbi:MAG TPA: TIGR01777 family protein [Leucothrix sp.]|nr:TIGR01777 family protein [Leucothrix sp.]
MSQQKRGKTMYQQRYLITGGTGFIGTPLVKQLLQNDQQVTVLTRDIVKTANHFADVMDGHKNKVTAIDDLGSLNPEITFDVVINLAGQGIADKRWTPQIKKQLIDSRVKTTKALCEYLEDALVKPDVFISGSALGYYGLGVADDHNTHNAPVDENGEPDNSFSSQLCVAWENEAKCIEKLGIRTCYLRTGIVLGKNGGALSKMLPSFKLGLGGPMGSGKQWMPWIHRDDLIAMIHFIVENDEISGAVNGTAPNPVSNEEFSKVLGKVLKRPAFIPMPAFVLKLMLGEMAEELLLAGRRVVPAKMMQAGYEFTFADLEKCLLNIKD